MPTWLRVLCMMPLVVSPLMAQEWNDRRVMELVDRAAARRAATLADSALRDFRARAHGFVFFLGQLGEGLAEPPRLVKSDELVLEVYWKTPGHSKQRIVGWRDRTDLPTDIQYHRDHLGIVQNNFGDLIRLGHGDEVRDVPHPLAPRGRELYDYALRDSTTLRLPQRVVRVYRVTVRPRVLDVPRIIGSMFIDVETAELVVFRFSFTRAAYLDDTLEDISIVLENGLFNSRWWLPRRQEIEIRRRTKWLDLPARGIIRGRWEIEDYAFNLGVPDTLFRGAEIVAAPQAARDTFAWEASLDETIRAFAGPAMTFDLEAVRAEIGQVAGSHAISGLAASRPAVGAISDLVRFNRVEGLALGAGFLARPGAGPVSLRVQGSFGFGDERPKGGLTARYEGRHVTLELLAERRAVDIADEPVIAPAVNSLLAQEAGNDYGDYVLRDRAQLMVRRDFGPRGAVTVGVGVERTTDMGVSAAPAHGTFRPNPALAVGSVGFARLTLEQRTPQLSVQGGVAGRLEVEGGTGDAAQYVRLRGSARAQWPLGGSDLVLRAWAGWGSNELPAYRAFVVGGRGTVVSDPFRAWGGRSAAVGTVEWRTRAPFPGISLGPFLSTGRHVIVAPFVTAGAAGHPLPGLPWTASDGVRLEVGLALEWFHRLLRFEAAVGRDGDVGVTLDLGRDLWGIL